MTYYFASNLKPIEINPNWQIGKGTDGTVFKYNQLALKILKFDNKTREQKGQLDFEKAQFFVREIKNKRINFPIDILLDENGIYSGIVMNLISLLDPSQIDLSQFSMDDLFLFIEELTEDYEKILTPKKIVPKDINFGSYCVSPDFLQMCDVDKYCILSKESIARIKNNDLLIYSLAKSIYYLNFITVNTTKEERQKWQKWVKLQVKEQNLARKIERANQENHFTNVNEYIIYTRKKVLES